MKLRSTLILTIAAAAVLSGAASAQVKLRPTPNVDWPFGEYRVCFGNTGVNNVAKQFVEEDQARMADAGQPADKQYLVNNWSVVILNEQIIAAHEYTAKQCELRKAGEGFDTDCPLGNMSRSAAVKAVGADKPEFWNQPSSQHAELKKEQKARLNNLGPVLAEACGP
ncbi:hypothetical protein J7394_05730 [Ruegeria sp. R13_0]|uniref:hypothetical protein n=1 Tax=Ruegeria sp. R13_0 TaxID=2821099 RepID=UPI001ADB216A|nr:hypothetical protein [Ruegeria sp. R13_0]MBO9433695.1 hypothetical protein [Ruegeria sp. R13_0]